MVRKARGGDRKDLAKMRSLLWPESTIEEHDRDFDVVLERGMNGTLPMAILVADDDAGRLTGFLEVGLRSHADGCDAAQPVGFIEGWFVYQEFRQQGIGRQLMQAAETWAREQGCKEMGSDTWLGHDDSQRAHQALGFEVVDRCVHFRKAL